MKALLKGLSSPAPLLLISIREPPGSQTIIDLALCFRLVFLKGLCSFVIYLRQKEYSQASDADPGGISI